MHVVQVNYAYDASLGDPDGLLERYTTLTGFARSLAAAGVRVTVVQRFARRAREVRDGVSYLFRRGLDVNRTAIAAEGDLVHVNGLVFPVQSWLLGRALSSRAPVVVQDHAAGDPPAAAGLASLARRCLRRRGLSVASGFLFTAAEQAAPWRREGIIAPHQPIFEVMEAAPGLARMERAEARRASGVAGTPALLWVGRLTANKDPLTVLAGFERALPHLPDPMLTMVYGERDLLPEVTRRVGQSAELRRRVRLVGAVPHDRLGAFFSAADLFVLGSHREGSGYALLEACACGTVPVVTDIPSFRVITDRGRCGALWRPGDAGAFARALVDVAARDLRTLSTQTSGHAQRSFSWPAIARAAERAYLEVISRWRSALPPLRSIRR